MRMAFATDGNGWGGSHDILSGVRNRALRDFTIPRMVRDTEEIFTQAAMGEPEESRP
jgi:hypothetical protein